MGLIVGEHHAGFDRLAAMLDATHVVTLTNGDVNVGEFRAVPR